jgi:RNA-directed DNA polymerase
VQRLRKFRLELHPDKTRLVEFGCYAAVNRQRRGQGNPRPSRSLALRISAARRDSARCQSQPTCDRKRKSAGMFIGTP